MSENKAGYALRVYLIPRATICSAVDCSCVFALQFVFTSYPMQEKKENAEPLLKISCSWLKRITFAKKQGVLAVSS